MAVFKSYEEGVEVNGATIMSVVKGMESFALIAKQYLLQAGLNEVQDDPNAWYPQQTWLDAFKLISENIGDSTLFQIGKKIPESAQFPPTVNSVESALQAIDVAYHMNHRKNGQILFDPATGTIGEGIGNYHFRAGSAPNTAMVIAENPYPDSFDKGIIFSIASKFTDTVVTVEADTSKPVRSTGGASTTFLVSW